MPHRSESDYRLLPSFIASTLSVLNPRNNDLKSFGHAIAFAIHPTDCSSRRVYLSSNSRFIQHWLGKIKYPVLPNKIAGLEDKLNYRINLFSFDDAFGYNRYAQYILKRFYFEEINRLFVVLECSQIGEMFYTPCAKMFRSRLSE